jgi:hypothetical protein
VHVDNERYTRPFEQDFRHKAASISNVTHGFTVNSSRTKQAVSCFGSSLRFLSDPTTEVPVWFNRFVSSRSDVVRENGGTPVQRKTEVSMLLRLTFESKVPRLERILKRNAFIRATIDMVDRCFASMPDNESGLVAAYGLSKIFEVATDVSSGWRYIT